MGLVLREVRIAMSPLKPGKKNVGANIKTEMAHGKPQDQAIAIALSVAGGKKRKKVGRKRK